MSNDDRVTVGLTPAGEKRLETVMESRFFSEELTAYRVAIAVAVAEGEITPSEEMGKVRTKFNVGSLEQEGRLREMIELLRPRAAENGVMKLAEQLADAGMKILAERIEADASLREVLLKGMTSE